MIRLAHERAQKNACDQLVRETPETLQRNFYRKTGFYAAGNEALQIAAAQYLAEGAPSLHSTGAWQRVRMGHMLDDLLTAFDPFSLRVLVPEGEELVIGDNPVLTRRHGQPEAGVLAGVALGEADQVFMPPRHDRLGVLSCEPGWGDLPAADVRALNSLQLAAAHTYVFHRPKLSEAPSYGQTILTYDPGSRGATSYRDAAREIATSPHHTPGTHQLLARHAGYTRPWQRWVLAVVRDMCARRDGRDRSCGPGLHVAAPDPVARGHRRRVPRDGCRRECGFTRRAHPRG